MCFFEFDPITCYLCHVKPIINIIIFTIFMEIFVLCISFTYKVYIAYAQVTHSRTGRRISHGYNPASFVANCIGP